jgi:NAD(P)-dependent dehydrogenase (short-subunit alcohol dehydrogenase family)
MEKARKKWIDRKIPDLKGTNILITGGTSGIGYEAALGLAYKGAHVYIACRNIEKAQKALSEIKKEVPGAFVDFVYYDQGNLASIQKMADEVKDLDFSAIVLNAGVYFPTMEMEHGSVPSLTFMTNGVGTYACYRALVKKHGKARFVFVNSVLNQGPKKHDYSWFLKSDDFSRTVSYAVSKRAVMNTYCFAMQNGVKAYLTHPGITKTNILHSYAPLIKRLGNGFMYFFSHKAWKASLGIVWAASGTIPAGSYIVPRGLFHFSGYPKRTRIPNKKCVRDTPNLVASLDDYIRRNAP